MHGADGGNSIAVVAINWHLRVGDPNLIGWLIVAGYLVAAVVTSRAWRLGSATLADPRLDATERHAQRLMRRLWAITTVVLVVLGVNKQLDLQSLLIELARERARAQGWYDRRREYQTVAILGVILVGGAALAFITYLLRSVISRVSLALVGLLALVTFVVVRAASFHYIDKLLSLGDPIRVNWVLEIGGIVLIAVAAVQWRYRERARVSTPQGQPLPDPQPQSSGR
jgi:hypothetical protein